MLELHNLERKLLNFKNYFDTRKCIHRYLLECGYNKAAYTENSNQHVFEAIENQILQNDSFEAPKSQI